MKTRKQHLKGECTHREYYAQFVTKDVIQYVVDHIGKDRILSSKDPVRFNDIPLIHWDMRRPAFGFAEKMKAAGDSLTLAGKNCILKEAAKQFYESSNKSK